LENGQNPYNELNIGSVVFHDEDIYHIFKTTIENPENTMEQLPLLDITLEM
jgi:hypothetical protein